MYARRNSTPWASLFAAYAGIALVVVGLSMMLLPHSTFLIGVGGGLAYGGFSLARGGFRVASTGAHMPIEPVQAPRSIRDWWITPKRYPNGSSFAPRDHALLGSISIVIIVACLLALGWATQTIFSAG